MTAHGPSCSTSQPLLLNVHQCPGAAATASAIFRAVACLPEPGPTLRSGTPEAHSVQLQLPRVTVTRRSRLLPRGVTVSTGPDNHPRPHPRWTLKELEARTAPTQRHQTRTSATPRSDPSPDRPGWRARVTVRSLKRAMKLSAASVLRLYEPLMPVATLAIAPAHSGCQ
jgi:hypothetical protein